MHTRYFKFEFTNGALMFMTKEEALAYCKEKNTNITFDGLISFVNNPPRIRDNWRPGYDHALGREFRHRDERDRFVKEKGFIEGGRTKPKHGRVKQSGSKFVDDKTIKDAIDRGANISGNEAIALKQGKKLHVG